MTSDEASRPPYHQHVYGQNVQAQAGPQVFGSGQHTHPPGIHRRGGGTRRLHLACCRHPLDQPRLTPKSEPLGYLLAWISLFPLIWEASTCTDSRSTTLWGFNPLSQPARSVHLPTCWGANVSCGYPEATDHCRSCCNGESLESPTSSPYYQSKCRSLETKRTITRIGSYISENFPYHTCSSKPRQNNRNTLSSQCYLT